MKTQIDIDKFQEFINEQGINQRTRKDYVKWSRYICFKWLHDCGYTLTRIGLFFDKSTSRGYMNHTSVLHGVRMYEELKRYEEFKDVMNDIEPHLASFIVTQPLPTPDTSNLTEIEREIVECKSYIDFLNVRNKIIVNLAESKVSHDSFHLVG